MTKRAREYQEKALAVRIEIRDRDREATSYGNPGTVFQSLGQHDKARENQEKALAISVLCMTRPENIRRKHLRSQKKLVTGMEKKKATKTLELCVNHSVNVKRPENIRRKHSPSE